MKTSIQVLVFIISFSNLFGQKNGTIKIDDNSFIYWEIEKFDISEHTFEYCLESDLKYLCKIDKQDWFGSDRGLDFPKNELKKLEISINKTRIPLETAQMFNPNFSGALFESQFKLKRYKDHFILFAFFSDGTGSYSAHWKIEDGKSERIVLSIEEEFFEWQLE